MVQRWRHRAAVVVCALAAAGCGVGGADSSGTQLTDAAGGARVAVVDNDFEPASLEVAPGETVRWVWEGEADHNVVAEDFSSETQRSGTFTHTFEAAGEHPYRCTLHAGMDGVVVVGDR